MENSFQEPIIRKVDSFNLESYQDRRLKSFLNAGVQNAFSSQNAFLSQNAFPSKKTNDILKKGDSDEFLSELLNVLKIKTLVVGVGGAGNNTVSRLQESGIIGTNTLNVNTDAQDLYYSHSNSKLLIGKEISRGLGSGNNPDVGMEAAECDSKRIKEFMDADVVFLTCGLGGGTGTGATPIVAREAKKAGAVVVTFCTLPFEMEGEKRVQRATVALQELAKYSDSLIPIPNDRLFKLNPNISLITGFKIMDEVLVRSTKALVELINNCGLVNLDYADIRNVLKKSGKYPSGIIGIAESVGDKIDLINKTKLAINNPLLEPETKKINSCIVSISGDHDIPLSKINNVVSTVSNEISNIADLKFGAMIDPTLKNKTKILFLGKGPISPYLLNAVDSKVDIPEVIEKPIYKKVVQRPIYKKIDDLIF
jgi:cell division protein FtsZ